MIFSLSSMLSSCETCKKLWGFFLSFVFRETVKFEATDQSTYSQCLVWSKKKSPNSPAYLMDDLWDLKGF